MSERKYALTITQSRGVLSQRNYDRALDAYAKKWRVEIRDRCYEVGKTGRLHVHATVYQTTEAPAIISHEFKKTLQKNHRKCCDFGPVVDPPAWSAYCLKDQPPKRIV